MYVRYEATGPVVCLLGSTGFHWLFDRLPFPPTSPQYTPGLDTLSVVPWT